MSKNFNLALLLVFLNFGAVFSQNPLFDDSKVPSIFVEMPTDSFNFIIQNTVADRYFLARFIFDDGTVRDTFEKTGIRLRGNTSLGSQKKSFKLSFNEFVAGGRYRGVKKVNLNGSHNDPTMIREKLFYEVWNTAGMPKRRVNFVKFFVNGEYRGLYSNIEELDKEWLERVFPEKEGNFYKCTWPADLDFLGDYQTPYKKIMNNATTRAYDLTTNETADDYSDLVTLITALSQNVDANFPAKIEKILNVESVLKAFAIDIATGNWDDYFYNKNNFYLYHNLETGKFEFITYDTDNTFGVDWLGKDWAKRNVFTWQKTNEPRPLASQLLKVPAFKAKFVQYLDSVTRFITLPDTIFPRIDELHALIISAAKDDIFRTLDYGYTMDDFHNGFTQTVDNHTPYGIKPFLGLRGDSTQRQIAGLLTGLDFSPKNDLVAQVFPNPFRDGFQVFFPENLYLGNAHFEMTDLAGRQIYFSKTSQIGGGGVEFSMPEIAPGVYFLKYFLGKKIGAVRVVCQ